jgi:acyl-CoA thioesterase I
MCRLFLLVFLFAAGHCCAASATPAILVFGDSLSNAYGLAQEIGWVTLLQRRLNSLGYPHRVINTSVNGETTSGGAARIGQALASHRPAIVVLELGGNDGLRGLPIAMIRANLDNMLSAIVRAGAKPVVVGLQLPPNYGAKYTSQFERIYGDSAREFKASHVPSLLQGLGTTRQYFQSDGIHPTAQAQPILLENVWRPLQGLLGSTKGR